MTGDAYLRTVEQYQAEHPEQRSGQAHFNVLHEPEPALAERVRANMELDPFYVDERLPAFLAFVLPRVG